MTYLDEPLADDPGSIAGLVAAKKAGLLAERFQQSREDYNARVAAMKAAHWAALTSGEQLAIVTRRIDYHSATGEWTAQRRRGDVPLEAPRVVARSPRHLRLACVRRRVPSLSAHPVGRGRSRGRREHRPGQRRTRSASRAGPGGSDSGEPDPPSAAGPGDGAWLTKDRLAGVQVRGAAERVAGACSAFLTLARTGLGGDEMTLDQAFVDLERVLLAVHRPERRR